MIITMMMTTMAVMVVMMVVMMLMMVMMAMVVMMVMFVWVVIGAHVADRLGRAASSPRQKCSRKTAGMGRRCDTIQVDQTETKGAQDDAGPAGALLLLMRQLS